MPTAVVTGANSGIGYAFAKLLISKVGSRAHQDSNPSCSYRYQQGYNVYATDVDAGPSLQSLDAHTSTLDITSAESMAAFCQAFGDQPLDLLLNMAGLDPIHSSNF